jgi:hypothetical protein
MKGHALFMRFFTSLSLLIVLMISCTVARATIVDRVTATVRDTGTATSETFQLDIDEVKVPMKWPNDPPGFIGFDFVDTVHISCIKGCLSSVSYSDQFDYGPISVFRLSDASPDLVTLWGEGDHYIIRVFHVGNGSITKVLDEISRTWPRVEVGKLGSLAILLSPNVDANYPTPTIFRLWKWKRNKYQVLPGNRTFSSRIQ